MINVVDRVPTHAGRIKLTPVSGQTDTYDMVRADAPTVIGTPINKALFDALQARDFIVETGSYTNGSINRNKTLYFANEPLMLIIYGTTPTVAFYTKGNNSVYGAINTTIINNNSNVTIEFGDNSVHLVCNTSNSNLMTTMGLANSATYTYFAICRGGVD